MALHWSPDKYADEKDWYGVNIDEKWLENRQIDRVEVTALPESELTVSNAQFDTIVEGGKTMHRVYAYFEGGVKGSHPITLKVFSGERERKAIVYLIVI